MNPAGAVDSVLYTLPYRDKNRLRGDAIMLLNSYRELRPNAAPAPTFPQPLFNLTGTIPVIIQANRYNIPIRMWIPLEYPYRPPMVYVTPTSGMSISPNHPNVNPSGVVSLPYLQTWNPATHNLLPLVQAMVQVFGQRTPLYQAPRPQQQPSYPGGGGAPYSPSGYPSQAPGGYQPPYPGQQQPPAGSSYSPYAQQQQQQQPGPYPPQPQPDVPKKRRAVPKTPMDEKRDKLREMCRAKIREMTKEDLSVKTQRLEQEKREKENLLSNSMSQQDQMKKEIADLTQKIRELDDFLAKNSGEMDVDKVTDPQDVHRLQLIHTVSLDMAIEDILYHFDRALLKGVISLDEYLKLCRQYSNDQFYQRALIKRIREIFAAPPAC